MKFLAFLVEVAVVFVAGVLAERFCPFIQNIEVNLPNVNCVGCP